MATPRKYQRLLERRAPQDDRRIINFSEAFESQPGDATRYLIGAMAPVAKRYTERLIEQGDRVENQLQKRLSDEYRRLAFRRQGSVSNFTHIRFHSDVDVLVIIDKFHALEHPQVANPPYAGNPEEDLINLRARCAEELRKAFWEADIDDEGSTCVTISGASLACSVDAVPSNWFNTNQWHQSGQEYLRGIQVYNRKKEMRIKNLPFLFNHRIEQNDTERQQIPRCLIRLLKSIKADHEDEKGRDDEINLSSFDICSLVYRTPAEMIGSRNEPLRLIRGLLEWMRTVLGSKELQSTLMGVDDSRKIFDEPSKVSGLSTLATDLLALYREALQETQSKSIVSEAHLNGDFRANQ